MSTPGDAITPPPNAYDDAGAKEGMWSEADPHGGVMVGPYLGGRRDGEWSHYSKDGRLRSRGHFVEGELDGEWSWYRANGKLMQRGVFLRGEKHGLWERWDSAGDPIDQIDFRNGARV